jgi:hypothetical protein
MISPLPTFANGSSCRSAAQVVPGSFRALRLGAVTRPQSPASTGTTRRIEDLAIAVLHRLSDFLLQQFLRVTNPN